MSGSTRPKHQLISEVILKSSRRAADGINVKLKVSEGIWHQTDWEHGKAHIYSKAVKFPLWSNSVCVYVSLFAESKHTHIHVQSFCGQFDNPSQHAVGLYDNKVMRASRNFPLSSIFSSMTREREIFTICCSMLINAHVCMCERVCFGAWQSWRHLAPNWQKWWENRKADGTSEYNGISCACQITKCYNIARLMQTVYIFSFNVRRI